MRGSAARIVHRDHHAAPRIITPARGPIAAPIAFDDTAIRGLQRGFAWAAGAAFTVNVILWTVILLEARAIL